MQRSTIFACSITVTLVSFCYGQDAMRNAPSLPTGYIDQDSSVPSFFDEAPDLTGIRGIFGLDLLYNSNVNNAPEGGAGGRDEESDVSIAPSLSLSYLRQNRDLSVGANASVSRQQFVSESQFNVTNYSVGTSVDYQVGNLAAGANLSYSSQGGVNRINNQFLEQETFNAGVRGQYRLSGLTSFSVDWALTDTTNQAGGFNDMFSNTLNGSALWQATPLLSIGPGVRYAVREGGQFGGEFTMVGPTISANYQLEEAISLQSSFGYNFTDSPFGDSNQTNWSVSLNYERERWGLQLSLIRDVQASFVTGGGFDLTSSYQIAYSRRLGFGQFGLNASYVTRDPEGGGVLVGNARDSEFTTLGASLSFPVFAERATLNLNASWNEQSASNENFDFDAFRLGTGLTWSF